MDRRGGRDVLIALSLDGSAAGVAERERWITLTGSARPRPSGRLTGLFHLVTCYRVELYGWLEPSSDIPVTTAARDLAHRWYGSLAEQFLAASTLRYGVGAGRHLLRVAAGLESPSAGDQHLLAQVRRAHAEAAGEKTLGSALDRLLQTALRTGRRVRRESAFGARASSIVALALDAIAAHRGPGGPGRCVVVGAGVMARAAARALAGERPDDLVVVNRNLERARGVAGPIGGRTALLRALSTEVERADVVVVATGSAVPLLTPELIRRRDGGHPTLIVDLALPRNVDPQVGEIPGVRLLNLDDLAGAACGSERLTADRAGAEAIVADEAASFDRWLAESARRAALAPARTALLAARERPSGFPGGTWPADRTARRAATRLKPARTFRAAAEAQSAR
ncbi:MAG: NAD(P)-binding domain-containing protein [Gemmatimonadota bacterium]